MNTQTVSLDVTKKPSVLPVIRLRQGDKNGTTVNAEIYDNGEPLSLSGKAVKFAMQSPDGTAYYEADGTTSGNIATFAIDETYACAITGITDKAYVNVLEGSNVICSTNRVMVVIFESAEDGADPEQSYSSGITEATNRANAAAEAAEGVVLQAVPLMSETVRGGAQLGDGLSIVDGKLTAEAYGLPTMSASTKGGAKLGSGLEVVNDVLSVDASGIDAGVLPIAHGGTGASTAAGARSNLDMYSTGEVDTALAGKVSKSGDTMTGSLSFINNEIDRDAAAPSAKQYGQKMPRLKDADGETIGYIQAVRQTDGRIGMQLTPVNEKSDGTDAYGGMTLYVDSAGTTSYGVADPANFRSAISAVNKAGDTLTGAYYLKCTNIDRDGANPTSDAVGAANFLLRDNDNENLGYIDTIRRTDGRQDLRLISYNENNGTQVDNFIQIRVAKDGTRSYAVADAAAFRSAINTVDKSGDTFTGGVTHQGTHIYLKSTNIDRDGTAPSSNTAGNSRLYAYDTSGEAVGRIMYGRLANGGAFAQFSVYGEKTSDHSEVGNHFTLYANGDGTQTYGITSPANFRSAISAVPVRTQLYNNTTGTTGTVTLSATSANYNRMRIYFGMKGSNNTWQAYSSVDVYSPNGKKVSISVITPPSSNTFYVYEGLANISGTSITRSGGYGWVMADDCGMSQNYNYIYIVRVEGWNE